MPLDDQSDKSASTQHRFGFNKNAELVNGRLAMFSFLLLIVSELIYRGEPVTKKIFGIE